MAFVSTLTIQRAPSSVIQDGSTYSVAELVGYDDARDISYSALVALTPVPGGGDMELIYCLVEYDGETRSEHTYWSGKDVARFISREDRAQILVIVGDATKRLLAAARPERIFRVTVDANAPEAAMHKHSFIASVIESCGYRIGSTDIRHGRVAWWMEREPGYQD
jgi:hypothetical protein